MSVCHLNPLENRDGAAEEERALVSQQSWPWGSSHSILAQSLRMHFTCLSLCLPWVGWVGVWVSCSCWKLFPAVGLAHMSVWCPLAQSSLAFLLSSAFLPLVRSLLPSPPVISLSFSYHAEHSSQLESILFPSLPWPKRFRCMFYISSSFVASLANLLLKLPLFWHPKCLHVSLCDFYFCSHGFCIREDIVRHAQKLTGGFSLSIPAPSLDHPGFHRSKREK